MKNREERLEDDLNLAFHWLGKHFNPDLEADLTRYFPQIYDLPLEKLLDELATHTEETAKSEPWSDRYLLMRSLALACRNEVIRRMNEKE